jgi:hypothetical protein
MNIPVHVTQPDHPEPGSHHEQIATLFRTTILPRLSRLYRTSTFAADTWRNWAAVLRISDFGEEVTIYHHTGSANWHDVCSAGSLRAERWPTEPSQWEGKPPLLTLMSASAETADDDENTQLVQVQAAWASPSVYAFRVESALYTRTLTPERTDVPTGRMPTPVVVIGIPPFDISPIELNGHVLGNVIHVS